MNRTSLLLFLLLLPACYKLQLRATYNSTMATADYVVPSGCMAPSVDIRKNAFYIDAVNGSDSGDGSRSKPWQNLQKVIDSGWIGFQAYPQPYPIDAQSTLLPKSTKTVVQPGSVIYLMSGNYGDITLRNAFNTDFIEISAY